MSTWQAEGHKYEQKGSLILVDGRKAGWITRLGDETRVFVSPRDRAKHFFRIFAGWGISRALFNYLLKIVQVQEINLKIGTSLTLVSQMKTWEEHGIPYHKEPFEMQIILPEKYFTRRQLTLSELMENPKHPL
jgi:hypothetical protein